MSTDLTSIKLLEFQQPLRCCNVTAIAYAFSALGHSTTVDDIFYVTRIPLHSVLDDGMTLAETFDTCLKYVEKMGLPISVRIEHCDQPALTLEVFTQEIEQAIADHTDIHILNFNTRIAHKNPNLEGGHFALLADYNSLTQIVTVADTNPKRYTRFWNCAIAQLYQACVDKDPCAERSRGFIALKKLD
ncbi:MULTISPECIES: phytochelatin synthase family protein [unclassified Leptolyngbya]|uniref:phytochelatin synthase family protein n=1 Tax=unclassified Leptolyngbya TaxID=2650499 RepID=UPI00168605F1|nr:MULTISPECIES: phytochelatin synthase family protein [unclassified Leptolyngbya]MBD1913679.1 phytochelatin synthase [Leptolyngbya sp. FACHB-8]MBD2157059.1 phytochelatin synthase [Leptolyngbya sp. FACHB-16]